MPFVWDIAAWDEYGEWQREDRKTLRRINKLLRDIIRAGGNGIGKASC